MCASGLPNRAADARERCRRAPAGVGGGGADDGEVVVGRGGGGHDGEFGLELRFRLLSEKGSNGW